MPTLPSPAPRLAHARELRRLRILIAVQAGLSYAAIGRDEGLTRERVRQIVARALEEKAAETTLDHARVQIARLEPALRLAASAIGEGELTAIDRLIKVLDRLDKYSAVESSNSDADEGGRERLLAKLNTMAERMLRARKREAGAEAGQGAPSEDTSEDSADAQHGLDETKDVDPASQTDAASSGWLDLP